MKAIVTKYHPTGSRRGARISASDEDGNRAVIDYPHDLPTGEPRFRAAADQLAEAAKPAPAGDGQ